MASRSGSAASQPVASGRALGFPSCRMRELSIRAGWSSLFPYRVKYY